MTLTADQILALAPDAASAKAGSAQAGAAKWSALGASAQAQAIWGLCQGSGKEPYRAQIDLSGPAFKCSCPSRKFPCKHGLGLYLLFARDQAAFADSTVPGWVSDWLASRAQRSDKQAAGADSKTALTADELAAKAQRQQARADKRQDQVAAGLDVLDTWLADLARDGLAGLRAKPAAEMEQIAARLVDTQAAGLAARLRRARMALAAGSGGPHWHVPVARELAQLALLSHSYRRLERLPAPLQDDIRSAIGWVVNQDTVLAGAGLPDTWQVLGNHTQHDERISRRACYLRGRASGRWAMLLHFSAGAQALPPPMSPGSWHSGAMHFYPCAWPLRALFTGQLADASAAPDDAQAAPADIAALLTAYAQALAVHPLIEHFPLHLDQVTPQLHDGRLIVRAPDGAALPVAPSFRHTWPMLALSGGAASDVCGVWDGQALLPLSLRVGARVHGFDGEPLA